MPSPCSRRRLLPALFVVLGLLAAGACNAGDDEPAPRPQAPGTEDGAPAPPAVGPRPLGVGDFVTGLEAPWEVAFTPDGRAWFTERDRGRLHVIEKDGQIRQVRTFAIDNAGEGGLMGLAVSPDFESDGWFYAYYTAADDNRIVRFQEDGPEEPVLTDIPKARTHNGGRIAFGPDGLLYAGTGDAADAALAQDETSLAGKTLRMNPDGSVPDDNPFDGSVVWSIGHRNVQGLVWDEGGRFFITELGPDVDDEVNLVEPGANYGWPEVTGAPGDQRFVDAVAVFQPREASPSGAVILKEEVAGDWEGDLLLAALRGQRVWRLALGPDGTVESEEDLFVGEFGRVRQLVQAPDGSLWLLTNNRDGRGQPGADDDRIVRIVPPRS
jgi:glucose/arabinose dehydrogenase